MDALATLTLDDYLARLATGDAAPGGGAVAAITGAQAAALLSMVVAITEKDPSPATATLRDDLARSRRRLLELASEDGKSFEAVMQTYKLPNGTEAEKHARKAALERSLQAATEVPLAIMSIVAELFPRIERVSGLAKPTVASDAAIAVELWATALDCARYNVRINLKYLKDETYKRQAAARAAALTSTHHERRDALVAQLKSLLA